MANSVNQFHYTFTPGPLTSSDHIPLILDISSSSILTSIPKTFSFHRTNWDSSKTDDDLQMTGTPDIAHATLEDIDEALETWMTTVKTTADRHISKTSCRLQPAPRPSRTTQLLKIQFDALRDRASRVGWTYNDYRRYLQLRTNLQDTRWIEANKHWGRTLAGLAANYIDPRKFWRKVKLLSGKITGPDTFLVDNNGEKHYTTYDKEKLFTSI